MMARQLLVVVGYAEMAAAALLGGITVLYGPLVLREFPGGAIGRDGHLAEAKLAELGFYGVVFVLGLLLLVSAAWALPESPAPHPARRAPEGLGRRPHDWPQSAARRGFLRRRVRRARTPI